MKTALYISGELRTFRNCFNSFKSNILDPNNCDIFMHLYKDDAIKEALELYDPKKVLIVDKNHYFPNISNVCVRQKMHETNVDSLYRQWDNIKKSFDLIDLKYDCVVKLRYDIKYTKPIIFSDFDMNFLNVPIGGDWRGGLFDMFAFGSYEIMKTYSNLIEKINLFCEQGIPFHSETLNKHNNLNSQVKRFDYPILLRKDFNNLGNEEDRIFTL